MQLHRLDIKGFKSFGDPITIQFDEGVTGIVGPNGCGKSNVVDAIRWVLGEQKTRVLRSDKMDNVIFNGTKKRKPAQVAEVSLSFENNKQLLPAEYSKVTITRRYSREGESQYFLNNVPCRLKDINNLFLDTGIGSDSYAIIELKMVDEILNDKENSRRALFEKAAGIAKFKIRKRETLTQLEAVDKDLNRVEDLLYEIQKNLKALEKQAEQAALFFDLKKEYRRISVIYVRKSVRRLNENIQTLQNQIEKETEKRHNYQEAIQEKEADLEQQKQDVILAETQFYDFQQELNKHQSELKNAENEQKIKTERLRFLQEKATKLISQITQEQHNQQEIEKNLHHLANRKVEAEQTFEEFQVMLVTLKDAFETQQALVQEIQQQLKTKENQARTWQQEIFQLQKMYDIKVSQIEGNTKEIMQIQEEKIQQKKFLSKYSDEFLNIDHQLQDLQQDLENLQNFEQENQRQKQQLKQQQEQITVELQKNMRTFDAKNNALTLTESLVENLEGFAEPIKFLKKNALQWSEKPFVLLSEIIQYEGKYQLALQGFLESYSDYYVVWQEKEAFNALNLLQNEKQGRANFFILEKLPPTLQPSAVPQGLVAAIDVVNYPAEYEKLVQRILYQVYIIPENQGFNQYKHLNLTLISQNGQFISRKFIFTGGTQQAYKMTQANRLQTIETLKQEISLLNDEINTLTQKIQENEEALQTCRNNSKSEVIIHIQTEISELKEQYFTLKTKKEQTNAIVENIEKREKMLIQTQQELSQEAELLLPQIADLQAQTDNLQAQLQSIQAQWELENESLIIKNAQHNQQNIAFYQQKSKVENIQQEIEYKKQSQESTLKRLQNYQEEQEQSYKDLEKLHVELEIQDRHIYELQSKTPIFSDKVQKAEQKYYTQRGQITDQEKLLKEMQRQKELLDSLLQELNNKANELKIDLAALRERLAAEFQLNLDDVLQEITVETDELEFKSEQELKNMMEVTRKKIEKLGNINPMAMQNYQDMKERHDFIATQRQDLLNAKMTLLKTIKEMEDFAKKAFMDAYEKIRQNFIYVFRSLFSEEDTADLVLTEPELPLESKIEIIAKPKGKRPLTINQLSGGEKTLTATSLLFALYLLKPAPFCIFDEVDAPLDDTNTDKFNQIIKNFSQNSQFIIVTHNKRTMSQTDVMYGITMIEQGVSKVIPVDLRSLD